VREIGSVAVRAHAMVRRALDSQGLGFSVQ
jgi:hypothetical protein